MWGQDNYYKYTLYGWHANKSFPRAAHIFIQEYDGYVSPSGYKQSLISHNCLTLSATCMPETFVHVHPHKLYLEKVPLCDLYGASSSAGGDATVSVCVATS